jgi:hypothetical protein
VLSTDEVAPWRQQRMLYNTACHPRFEVKDAFV